MIKEPEPTALCSLRCGHMELIPRKCLVVHAGLVLMTLTFQTLTLFYDPSFWLSLLFGGGVVISTCNFVVAGQGRAVQGMAEQGRTKQHVCIKFSIMVWQSG